MKLPNEIPLNGSDYFQLILDRHQKLTHEVGNVGRFILTLSGNLDIEIFKAHLSNSLIFNELSSFRLNKKFIFQIPVWKKKTSPKDLPVFIGDIENFPNQTLNRSINLKKDAPISIDVYQFQNETKLIFSFHHALMDSRGMEILARLLGTNISESQLSDSSSTLSKPMSLIERLNHAKSVKEYLLWENRMSPAILANQKLKKEPQITYHELHFSEAETLQIEENAKKKVVRFGKSPFYLAATTFAFDELLNKLGRKNRAYWVPIPQDGRKKGAFGPILGNHVSYLFYRLFPKDLTDMKTTIGSISTQMMTQMRARIPQSYKVMMDLFRHLPERMYYNFTKSPTKGAISSFFFSDTGASLEGFDSFLELPVKDAIHYPPGAPHPGLTVVFSQFRGRLRVMLVYNNKMLKGENLKYFKSKIRELLLP